ncbi:MAG: hypothetical protein J0H60_00465 [Rhizobiales bacterium]|jgi:hypothetical protein|nr:hypothetical protein [Hyphomicrobiales bacterium]
MATILAFTPRKTTSGVFPGSLAKAGDVIIFPGVRYEQGRVVSQADRTVSPGSYAPGAEGSEPRH